LPNRVVFFLSAICPKEAITVFSIWGPIGGLSLDLSLKDVFCKELPHVQQHHLILLQIVTTRKCPQFRSSAQGVKQMFQYRFFMQSQCSINSNITIVTSVGVVAVIDVVRSQVF